MLRRPEAPPLGPRLRRAAEAAAAAAAAFIVLCFVGPGGGEVPLRAALRAAGRPVVAHVTKVEGAYVSFQYEAGKDYWPTVRESAVPPGVRDGDLLPAHAIGGRVGLARLDGDGRQGMPAFLFSAVLSLFVGFMGMREPLRGWAAKSLPRPGRLRIGDGR